MMILEGVYFIIQKEQKLTKIGVSNNIINRLRYIQTQNSSQIQCLGIILSNKNERYNLEHKIHTQFFEYRHHGEWFYNLDFDNIKISYSINLTYNDEINNIMNMMYSNNQVYINKVAQDKTKIANTNKKIQTLHKHNKNESLIYEYILNNQGSIIYDICDVLHIGKNVCLRILKNMISNNMIKSNEKRFLENRKYYTI